ncbi:restriction endonuclease subunit S [Butyrivibrio sp. M55]|uniref:restriction endonuclease subunit S n=1 Tax=Butyrivibrio sp. M55 TaxID=1855323 RepID=UPI0008DF1CF9|nr:restriction endonuclease subunit S [Butyrivibrio sp. M55]SFU89590.1 type I restriction enzyme, S subunit [Butyrivibrio sp. M55]
MGKLPNIRFKYYTNNWEQRKLYEVAEKICVGFVGTCEKYYTDESGIPMYRTGNLNGLKLNQDDLKYVTKEFHEQNKKSQLRKGDILIARHGDSGKAVNYELSEEANCLNIVIIRPDLDKCNYQFLTDSINSPTVSQHIKSLSAGSTQAVINTSEIEKLDVIIPANIAEQNKIAEFLNVLDNLITLHQRKCDETKELKKYMLQKMFPKNGEKIPEIRFDGFTDDWEQRKVSEVAEIVAGGTPSTKISNYWEPKEVPWLSSGEVHKKYITFTDNMISQEGMNNSSAKMIKENSVLIALAGQGKTRGTVAINRIPLTTNQSIAAMTFNDDIVPEFIFCNLENRYDEIRKMSSGDGARGGLNKQLVGDIEIPYTSYEEQKKIGTYFEQLDNLITLHQRKCDETKELKKYMLQNMFPTKG